ncbi:MAG: serine/threonine protein kinase, partial [Planctomycetota bacterium]
MSQDFLDFVRRSQLVEEDQLARFLADLKARRGGRLPESKEKLAEAMVDAELLSQWQADKLLAGKYKGFKLGKYKLLGAIGKGGMSHVYLAEH